MNKVNNTNINLIDKLITPDEIKKQLTLNLECEDKIYNWRKMIEKILTDEISKKLFIIGPCSIHDYNLAIDYAKKLKKIMDKVQDKIFICMRVYFEKPRTTVGWKGFIYDPDLNESYNINKGLYLSRKLLLQLTEMNIPVACEFLDTITPQYISDCVTWGAIGARTVESQLHRQLASGLSMPIGFKNATNGNIHVAIDGMISAKHRHVFCGIDENGNASIVNTKGNNNVHLILRGANDHANYDCISIAKAINELKNKNMNTKIMIDCSHGNSGKSCKNQILVVKSIIDQIILGEKNILGIMLESNIYSGNQKMKAISDLEYGKSITDECIDIELTSNIIYDFFEKL